MLTNIEISKIGVWIALQKAYRLARLFTKFSFFILFRLMEEIIVNGKKYYYSTKFDIFSKEQMKLFIEYASLIILTSSLWYLVWYIVFIF